MKAFWSELLNCAVCSEKCTFSRIASQSTFLLEWGLHFWQCLLKLHHYFSYVAYVSLEAISRLKYILTDIITLSPVHLFFFLIDYILCPTLGFGYVERLKHLSTFSSTGTLFTLFLTISYHHQWDSYCSLMLAWY